MSATILKIIPTNSTYAPEAILQDKAKTFLAKFYENKQIEIDTTDAIQFVDQGANFDSVFCNFCGESIEIKDWQNAMDKAYEKQFANLDFTTLCCNRKTSLNDLTYDMPAGFAKFQIKILEPIAEIEEKYLKELQQILGTTLRIIWARY
ncbi:MAG: hypothetical protein LBU73_09650 [Helicobacteraceae bacterium]|jgi:hypothetical protein|nr:hypothetical protein [Helicobacteraceae bacterium]